MAQVPPDFKRPDIVRLYNAMKSTEALCPAASAVLKYQLVGTCQELAESQSISPQAQSWLRQLEATTTEITDPMIESMRTYADNLYVQLSQQFQSGNISRDLPQQFLTCSVLFDCLEGDECHDLAIRSKQAAVKIKKMLEKAGAQPGSAPPPKPTQPGGPPQYTPSGGPPPSGPPKFTASGSPPQFTPSGGPPQYTPPSGPPQFTPSGGPPQYTPPSGPPQFTPSSGPPPSGPPQYKPPSGPPQFTPSGGPPQYTPPSGPPQFTPSGGPPQYTPPSGPPQFTPSGGPPQYTPPSGPPQFTPSGGAPPSGPPQFTPSSGPPQYTPPSAPPPAAPKPTPSAAPQRKIDPSFDVKKANQLLASFGYNVQGRAPPLSDESRARVQLYLEKVVSIIDKSPKDQVMVLLARAFKTWQNNTPQ